MKSIFFKLNKIMPPIITCLGSRYESTKEMCFGELVLSIDRELMKLSEEHFELNLKFHVNAEIAKDREKQISVVVPTHDISSYLQLKNAIEEVLWSFNKQVLHQSGGQFYTHYIRFTYVIKLEFINENTIKYAS
ncbi:MAG: hypothetical protein HOO06_09535 [Bdellovibrionaceae bacterium]|jgi:hypothetical protein|nr:hypothetical protein [Pseudobdellovibrionaceae bacterium]